MKSSTRKGGRFERADWIAGETGLPQKANVGERSNPVTREAVRTQKSLNSDSEAEEGGGERL